MNNLLKNCFLIILVLFSGLALPFYKSLEGMVFIFVLSLIMMLIFRIGFAITLRKAILVWIIFCVIVLIANRIFTPLFIFRHLVFIITSFVTIVLFKETLFRRIENIVYYFALISLLFWFWQLISLNSIVYFGQTIGFHEPDPHSKKEYINFLVYTINYSRYSPPIIPRNAGFCWEPGPFSIYLVIAIFFNMSRNNFKIVMNARLLILIAALLTTISTTGYLAFASLMIYYSFKGIKGRKRYLVLAVFISAFIYLYFTLDIMSSKISSLYDSGMDIENTKLSSAAQNNKFSSAGRFGGLLMAWEDLKRSPLWGTGGASELFYGNLGGGAGVFIVNGLARIMATYGLFGMFIYLFFLFKSSKEIGYIYNINARYVFVVIILICSFSNSLHRQIIPFTLIFFSLFYDKRYLLIMQQKHKVNKNS